MQKFFYYYPSITIRIRKGDLAMKNRIIYIWLALLITSASIMPLFSNTRSSTSTGRELRERTEEEIRRDVVGGWSYEILDPGPAAGFDVDMAIDSNGEDIHISYHNDNEDELMYAKWGGNYWNAAPISDMLVKNYGTAVAVNSQGKGYIAFADSGVLKILSNVQGDWISDVVEGGDGVYAGCYPSMEFDSQNRLHISYQDATQGVFDLKYAYKSGNDWIIDTVDAQDTTGKFTSLALDSNNRPHICYQKTEGTDLKYAYKDGGGNWHTETVDGGVEWVHGLHTSIALDSSNRPHIVYHSVKNGVDKYLSYAHWTGSEWLKENPDPDRNMGEYPSIIVDDNDRPHISYHDMANDDLKYAYYNGAEWELSTLDDRNVGTNTAIGLDGDGRPVIAYTDSASNSLLLIRWDDEAPVADAGADITVGQKDTVDFDGSASVDNYCVSGYKWTFTEDGIPRSLNGVDPVHKFTKAGSYTITLNVSDAAGNWHTDTMTVTVSDTTKPVANAGMDYYGSQGKPIEFNGDASTDNVGITTYKWRVVDEMGSHDLTGVTASHTFNEAGFFEVTLNVSDAAGNWAKDNASVTVRDGTPPVAVAGNDQTIDQGDSITLNAIESTDNFGVENYVWTFMDNGLQRIEDRKMTYKFLNAGTFIITLNVTDAAGNWGVDTVIIIVLDTLSPVASAGVDMRASQGEPVVFNASESTDNIAIVKYEWIFVYGNQTILLNGKVANYIFDIIGTYDVRLIVKDSRGNKDETTISVNVTDGIPPVPVISTNTTGYLGEKVILNASGSTDNTEIVQYTWKFEYIGDTKILYGKRVAYNFPSSRDYNISLNITDREGNWAKDHFILSIIKVEVSDDDTGGDDDDSTGGGGGGVGTDDKGAMEILYRNCLWLSIMIIVILVVGSAIIIALVVAKKKKAEEMEREKKEEEVQERELTPEEYYSKLYGPSSPADSSSQSPKARVQLPPGVTYNPPPAGPSGAPLVGPSGPPPAGMPRARPPGPVSPGPQRPATGPPPTRPSGPPPAGMPRVRPPGPVSPGSQKPAKGPSGPPPAGMPRARPPGPVPPGP